MSCSSPYPTAIPSTFPNARLNGLRDLTGSIVPIPEALSDTPTRVTIRRISEQIQSDTKTMLALKRTGVQPGKEVTLEASDDGVRVIGGNGEDGESIELPRQVASLIFVTRV